MERVSESLRILLSKGIPMRVKYRQMPNPHDPVSPFPLLRAYHVPRQELWPILLDAFVYLKRSGGYESESHVIDTCITSLRSLCRGLHTYPGYYLYKTKSTAEEIVSALKMYTDGTRDVHLRTEEHIESVRADIVQPLIHCIEQTSLHMSRACNVS